MIKSKNQKKSFNRGSKDRKGVPGKLQLTGDRNTKMYDKNPRCILYYT